MKRRILALTLLLSVVLTSFSFATTTVHADEDCNCAIVFSGGKTKYIPSTCLSAIEQACKYGVKVQLTNVEKVRRYVNDFRLWEGEVYTSGYESGTDDIENHVFIDCVKSNNYVPMFNELEESYRRELSYKEAINNPDWEQREREKKYWNQKLQEEDWNRYKIWNKYRGKVDVEVIEANKEGYGTYRLSFTCKHNHHKEQIVSIVPDFAGGYLQLCYTKKGIGRTNHELGWVIQGLRAITDEVEYPEFYYGDTGPARWSTEFVRTITNKAGDKCIGGRIGWIQLPEFVGAAGFETEYVYNPHIKDYITGTIFNLDVGEYFPRLTDDAEFLYNGSENVVIKKIVGTYKQMYIPLSKRDKLCCCNHGIEYCDNRYGHYEGIPCVNGKVDRFATGYTWKPWTLGKPNTPNEIHLRQYTIVNGKRLYSPTVILPIAMGWNYRSCTCDDQYYKIEYRPYLIPELGGTVIIRPKERDQGKVYCEAGKQISTIGIQKNMLPRPNKWLFSWGELTNYNPYSDDSNERGSFYGNYAGH